ncbi:ATP-binding cassette transporter snq2 [Diplodia intermedia]|uniref:ATP-binding cassette transporter snq2 n=1 Tax=Diplodia intermedia TaxID=856260 RepID=A0ABR3TBJ6_9PEZI
MDSDHSEKPTPDVEGEIPGGWLETPATTNEPTEYPGTTRQTSSPSVRRTGSAQQHPLHVATLINNHGRTSSSGEVTAVPSPKDEESVYTPVSGHGEDGDMRESIEDYHSDKEKDDDEAGGGGFMPIKTGQSQNQHQQQRPGMKTTASGRAMTEDDLFRVLSRRRTNQSAASTAAADQDPEHAAEQEEIDRLLSRMFGQSRQQNSEEERTRHTGVVFKGLTVRGMGVGAALQPTTGDIFLNPVRFVGNLVARGPRRAAGKPPVRTLIDNFSGCVRPGEMLLVLGRPGAGCSTFLKVVGNQRFGYESVEGDVTYGGTSADVMAKKYRSEVLYNPEEDLHYATLSVKNTLTFALKTKTPGQDSRKEGESKQEYVKEFLRVVSKLFWIEHTLGTKVGSAFVRGVSGGEKKRVSIAEAMITKASVQAWDNSTKGLDASTALEYVQSLRSLTNMARVSTSVALYQAGESLYDLFDKVVLIDEGKCCYFGPADEAPAYFKEVGFVQPPRWTNADFLTSVTDPHERHVKEGWENRIPRSAEQFADAFFKSERHRKNLKEIEEFQEETRLQEEERRAAASKATKTKNYTISFPQQVIACTKRQFLVMIGDKQSLAGKWGGILFQALIVGSLFYDQPKTAAGVFTRGGVMFFMLLFNALLALAELTAAFDSRPILLKHKSFSFYRPAAYALAQTVVDVPLVLIQVAIFDIVVYFMSNLQRTASQFFISLLFLFILTMTMYAFFRAIGALVDSLDVATRLTGVAIQILVVYTGYLIPPRKMHPWFGWLRWVNPVQYGFEGLMANEFYNLDIECVTPYLVPQVPGARPQYQTCALQGSQPGRTTVAGADYISVAYSYSRSHLWRNFGIICAFFIFFVCLTALGMELQKPNKGGGSVTIYKRGQAPESVKKEMESSNEKGDEEKGRKNGVAAGSTEGETSSGTEKSDAEAKGVAKNDTIFTWQNVNYTIPYEGAERKLLQNVQGYVKPGKLTALMGASGAGKTTLLNTLAQRIRFGVVTGDFLVDGRPLPLSFQRSTGFAEQQDVHEATSTVREALRFSAKLRQPREVPLQEKYDYVEKIIDLLEMREIAGATVGKPGVGLNQEQRKRLTIGVELASKPELLMFLDEPTSGLDSGAAFNIVRFLRKLADAGQAILCTIHQPSSVLFENFDQLLLLKNGGRTVYFGELGHDSRNLINYLERNGAKKCPSKMNPAEYMLEAIGAGNPDYKGQDWGDVWEGSPENEQLSQEVQQIISDRRQAGNKEKVRDDREYAMPLSTQVFTVLKRSFVAMYRSPQYVMGMTMLHIFTGLFNGFTFWNVGHSQIDMQSRLFSTFMTLTISPPLIQQLQPRFLEARSIFESRESNSKIYSWFAFTTAAIVSEIPYRLVAGTIYWACWYFPPNFPRDTYTSVSIWALVMVFELYYLGFGQAIASFSPNELLASLLVPIFFLFVVSFCGVVVPYATLPYFWRSWMYHLSPFRYLLEGFLGLLTHNQRVQCDSSEIARFNAPPGQTCESYAGVPTNPDGTCGYCQYATGDQFASSFNVFYRYVWRDFGIMWAYILFNFAVVYACSWLYLSGGRRIKQALSPTQRRQQKEKQKQQQQQQEVSTGGGQV